MAKVKINSLPPGFTIKDGKVITSMQQGGTTTGDQFDFGLTTTVKSADRENDTKDVSIKYTLNAVPREEANIEAEGGETVLTDLDNDGLFGLYEIKGPRHTSGGVPLNLPEQSFIFSDTKDMKLGGKDLEEFGIKSKRKLSPAKISKKYDLNTYYGSYKDQFADDISIKSAELMMDKNKQALSKLAFVQESKKDFKEGVPVASHGYLVSQGIDPIDFTAKVEKISAEKAAKKAIDALPEEKRQQVLALQQMMQQAESSEQQMAQEPSPEQMVMETGKYGKELRKAAPGFEMGSTPSDSPYVYGAGLDITDPDNPDALTSYGNPPYTAPLTTGDGDKPKPKANANDGRGPKKNVAVDQGRVNRYNNIGVQMDFSNVGETKYVDLQPSEQKAGRYGDATQNEAGWVSSWKGIYPESDQLILSLDAYKAKPANYKNPEVVKFQKWTYDEYIPAEVERINQKRIEAGYAPLNEQQTKDLTDDLRKDFGFDEKQTGKGYDGKFGTFTSSRRPFTYQIKPNEIPPPQGCPCPDGTFSQECCPKPIPPKVPPVAPPAKRPGAEWWLQDLIQLNAIANRERDMFFPFQPAVANVDLGYVLEEPTRAIAATNERLGLQTQAAASFGGPQALAARTAQAQGQAAAEIANEVARVNQRNVSTINNGLAMQAQMDMQLGRERRDRTVKEYDDTQAVLQRYMDEKNFDREQYAMSLSNAVTNRANTYNLNSIQDYFQIDPTTGGMLGQFSGKAFEAVALPDPNRNIRDYAETARMLKAAGIEPTAELVQGAMGQPVATAQETNAQRAFRSLPPGFGYAYNPGMYQQGKGKKGKEIKPALPFFMGKIGE
jgi:hypothetical protein